MVILVEMWSLWWRCGNFGGGVVILVKVCSF